jgi:DNA-binding GntR family transcriptional regulator
MNSGNKIRSESLAQQAFAFLQKEITEGRMKPGERIVEKEISNRHGISRTPIREALLKLQMAGVVVCSSRRSYHVRVLTVADVKETYEILGILEGEVVGAAAQSITEDDLSLLKDYNQQMATTAHSRDFHAFGAWNEKFHDVLLSKHSNRSLRDLCDSVRRLLYVFPVRHSSFSQWIEGCVEEHEQIIRLAAAKDGPGLRSFFREVHWNHRSHSPYIEDAYAGEDPAPLRSDAGEQKADELPMPVTPGGLAEVSSSNRQTD